VCFKRIEADLMEELKSHQKEGKNLVFNLKTIFQEFVTANETGKWLPSG
jgi:hypothetical protein